jgi:hypothetical protein
MAHIVNNAVEGEDGAMTAITDRELAVHAGESGSNRKHSFDVECALTMRFH